jgi:hypothetical protein
MTGDIGDIGIAPVVMVLVGIVNHAIPVLHAGRHARQIVILDDSKGNQSRTGAGHHARETRADGTAGRWFPLKIVVGTDASVWGPRLANFEARALKLTVRALEDDDVPTIDPRLGNEIHQSLDQFDSRREIFTGQAVDLDPDNVSG